MKLSKIAANIKGSSTLAITSKAKQLKSEGKDVVSFGAGEPDFDTPEHIKQAAIRSLEQGNTKYTPAAGTKEMKNAVIRKFKNENGLTYDESEVIINCGAKHSLFNVIMCTVEKGDEVIVPSPFWVSYPEMIKAAGADCVIADCISEPDFKLNPEILKEVVTENSKMLILNSPSNPTGIVYTKDELKAISDFVIENDMLVISDEIYEHLVYDGEFFSIAQLSDEIKSRTIVINGVSKAYSMTGWRIGYAAGNKEIIAACSRLQSHSTSNPTSFAQSGAVEALISEESPKQILRMKKEFEARRNHIYNRLDSIEGIRVNKPSGAFYIFPDISELLGKGIDSAYDFSVKILEEELVALVPGEGFGAPGYIRLSYATSMEEINKGIDRLEKFVEKIRNP